MPTTVNVAAAGPGLLKNPLFAALTFESPTIPVSAETSAVSVPVKSGMDWPPIKVVPAPALSVAGAPVTMRSVPDVVEEVEVVDVVADVVVVDWVELDEVVCVAELVALEDVLEG